MVLTVTGQLEFESLQLLLFLMKFED